MAYDPATLLPAYTPSVPSNTLYVDGHEDDLHQLDRQELRGLKSDFGLTPTSGDQLGYTRLSNGAGKGIWVPDRALLIPNPIVSRIWQEKTSFTSVADGTWTADTWIYNKSSAAVHDVLRSTDVPSVAAFAPFGVYSIHLDVTTADSSIAAGDFSTIATRIEGWLWQDFAQQVFTLSFWVKAAKTGVHCVYFRNSGNDRTYVGEYTVSAADTWEWKSITVLASPSAGTWDYGKGRGLEIGWTQACGSTYQTTAGAWQTGNYKGTSNQVNETDNTANNFKIFRPRINLGSYALTPVQRPYDQELALAKRYLQIWNQSGDPAISGAALSLYPAVQSTSSVVVPPLMKFDIEMRDAPVFTHDATAWNTGSTEVIAFDSDAGGYWTVSSLSITGPYLTPKFAQLQANNITSGAAGHIGAFNIGASVKLMFASRVP